MKDTKKTELSEMKTTVSVIKYTDIDGSNCRLDTAEERIHESEDTEVETTEGKGKEKIECNEAF